MVVVVVAFNLTLVPDSAVIVPRSPVCSFPRSLLSHPGGTPNVTGLRAAVTPSVCVFLLHHLAVVQGDFLRFGTIFLGLLLPQS